MEELQKYVEHDSEVRARIGGVIYAHKELRKTTRFLQ